MTGRPTRADRARPKATHNTVTLLDLIQAGLVAAPAELTASAAGREFAARLLEDGAVEFAGERHASPSTAAGRALNEANGPPPDGRPFWPTNGWTFWRYRDPATGEWRRIDQLRRRYRDGGAA